MADTATHTSSEKQTIPGQLWTVFLVDDDPDDLALGQRALQALPQIGDIICVTNGDELFRVLHGRNDVHSAQSNCNLIMLDIHMPEPNGMALLNRLKSYPGTEDIPVVMLTGDHRIDNIEKSYRMNADAFITKPLSEQHFKHIHDILNRNKDRKEIF